VVTSRRRIERVLRRAGLLDATTGVALACTSLRTGVLTWTRVSVVEPGAVDSEFVSNASLDPDVMIAAAGPYADVLGRYLDRTIK